MERSSCGTYISMSAMLTLAGGSTLHGWAGVRGLLKQSMLFLLIVMVGCLQQAAGIREGPAGATVDSAAGGVRRGDGAEPLSVLGESARPRLPRCAACREACTVQAAFAMHKYCWESSSFSLHFQRCPVPSVPPGCLASATAPGGCCFMSTARGLPSPGSHAHRSP